MKSAERPATVLAVHNSYQMAGGEDAVWAAEADLLERRGHRVVRYQRSNRELHAMSAAQRTRAAVWNHRVARELTSLVMSERPAIAHFHNTHSLISPAALRVVKSLGTTVVLTLHNYRLVCPGALLMRNGTPCEECVGSPLPWRGVFHRCHRGSLVASAGTATTVSVHRLIGTWSKSVDAYVALSNFAREVFVRGGLPSDRIFLKPNFVAPDPGVGKHRGGYALFVGRLTDQKGVAVMLEAWRQLGGEPRLVVVGDGPMAADVSAAADSGLLVWRGALESHEVVELMRAARFLIFPSISYENCPLVVLEALATGLPVVASGFGSMTSLVEDGVTGWHMRPGSAQDLADTVKRIWEDDPHYHRMSGAARRTFETRYHEDANYRALMDVYSVAAERTLAD